MKLGIMQPYFAPYLGYFDLIRRCDRWISFDSAQYIRHGWVNRNRVLHPTKEWQYLIVPLRQHPQAAAINQVEIAGDLPWPRRIEGQLNHYRDAPHYAAVTALLRDCFAAEPRSLSRLNVLLLRRCCDRLGLKFPCETFSEMGLRLPPIAGPGDWALQICRVLGATEYLNPPGGEALFDRGEFERHGIELTIVHPPPFVYDCPGRSFVDRLSIVDVMMWNSPERIRAFLESASPLAAAHESHA